MVNYAMTRDRIFLALILALAGFLSFYAAGSEGFSNTYYSAAVKSMLTGWSNFFFVSFDPGGFVSVDKPPLGLWIQALSATIFGFQGWSLILPQALAMVISTALVYHLVRRTFGNPAGLIAALIFALTPIVAAVSRTNNLDSMLVMFLLLAAWAAIVASERGSLKLFLLSMALVGLGFNVKMLEAFGVLPAILLIYFLSPANKTTKKIGHIAIAIVLLLAVSLSWTTIVDLTPADQRPYVGSSQTNSVLELALGYNGIQRILPGSSPMGAFVRPDNITERGTNATDGNRALAGIPPIAGEGNATAAMTAGPGGSMPGGGAFGGETGSPGVFRLFGKEMAGQISWLLPLAIFGFFAAAIILRKRKDTETKAMLRSLGFWGAWMLPMLTYFSISGFFHRYYLIMLAPSIAALCSIGLTTMWSEYHSRGRKWFLLPLSLATTALAQFIFIIRYPELSYWLIPVMCAFTVTAAVVLLYARSDDSGIFKGIVKPLAICGVAALLIAPAAWSVTPILYGSQTTLPYAGPELSQSGFMGDGSASRTGTGMGFPGMGDMSDNGLTDYLIQHMGGERFIVAVPSAMTASSIIIETGLPVMAVGGFSGGDPILTVDRLEKMVTGGEIRYYLMMGMSGFSMPGSSNSPPENNADQFFDGGAPGNRSAMPGPMGNSQSEVNDWVKTHGTVVPNREWMGDRAVNMSDMNGFDGPSGGFVLYDLKGSA